MNLRFLGATRTVTGSRFLFEQNGCRGLVDCGLFQGPRLWKERNWSEFPEDPASLNCVILTHAHIDHAGFLPRLMKLGFKGVVYATPPTAALLELMLPDSGHLQEEDAAFANKKKYTKHDPALPLYTEEDARESLKNIFPVDFYHPAELAPGLKFRFLRAGHILGSAMIEIQSEGTKFLFSGDVGRPAQYIIKKPDDIESVDYLVLESTYGSRLHQKINVEERLASLIRDTISAGGTILVPAFAIGRTQELLFILRLLIGRHQIPKIPVFIDSPMAIQALPIFTQFPIDFSSGLEEVSLRDATPFEYDQIHVLESVEHSMKLNNFQYPCIIISSSGMATGGRILHHLKRRIGDHRNLVLFIGFQAEGTKGRFLVDGAEKIKIHGDWYPVKAKIAYLDALSCHADYEEMLLWLQSIKRKPRCTFLVHGEESAIFEMRRKLENRFGWKVQAPEYLETFTL